jgi:hypothetical protein
MGEVFKRRWAFVSHDALDISQCTSPKKGEVLIDEFEDGSMEGTSCMMGEIQQTMALSLLMYQLVELRHKVANGEIILRPGVETSLPRSTSKLLSAGWQAFQNPQTNFEDSDAIIPDDKLHTKDVHITDVEHKEHMEAMGQILDHMGGFERCILDRTEVYVLSDDDVAVKESRVFSVSIDHIKKRVIVAFRGSVSIHDWMHNLRVTQVRSLIYRNM